MIGPGVLAAIAKGVTSRVLGDLEKLAEKERPRPT